MDDDGDPDSLAATRALQLVLDLLQLMQLEFNGAAMVLGGRDRLILFGIEIQQRDKSLRRRESDARAGSYAHILFYSTQQGGVWLVSDKKCKNRPRRARAIINNY